MNLEDKVNKIVGEIMTAHVSDLHYIIRRELEIQDIETIRACIEEIENIPSSGMDISECTITHDEAIAACQNANPWK